MEIQKYPQIDELLTDEMKYIMTKLEKLNIDEITNKTIKFTLKKVKTNDIGESKIMEIPDTHTVLDLKTSLGISERIPAKWIHLMLNGRMLNNQQVISHVFADVDKIYSDYNVIYMVVATRNTGYICIKDIYFGTNQRFQSKMRS